MLYFHASLPNIEWILLNIALEVGPPNDWFHMTLYTRVLFAPSLAHGGSLILDIAIAL